MERKATAGEGIWTIDAEGRTLYANEAMAQLLGTTVGEMIGRSSFEYVYPEDRKEARRLFDVRKRGGGGSFEFRVRRSDGSPVWVTVRGTPMRDSAGNFSGIIGTFRARSDPSTLKSESRSADEQV